MQESLTAGGKNRTRSRLALVTVASLFAAPVILAWLAFYVFPDWRPTGTVNHGELVTPVRPLPAFQKTAADGRQIDETFLRGKWTFVMLAEGECDDDCRRLLYTVRQIRLSQGKNIDRLKRLMLWIDPPDTALMKQLQGAFPGQVMLGLSSQADEPLLTPFQLDSTKPLDTERYYLVDPFGNLMMSYPGDAEPRGAIKDLERLLKYSGAG